jgi:toxin ParE1/3/4
MTIQFTRRAYVRLLEIHRYISKDSPARATKFSDTLLKHIEPLIANPQMGRIVPEKQDPSIRELLYKNYRIIYKINTNTIYIITIFEGHKLLTLDELLVD